MTQNTNKHIALTSDITDQPAVYVGTYHKYNSGSIAGSWIDLTLVDSKEEFYEICAELHKDEEDPEFMFQDFQGFPHCFYHECSLDDKLWEYLELIKDSNEDKAEAIADFIEGGYDSEDFEDNYEGQFDSEIDFAYHIVDELDMLHDVPENLKYYFDYEKYARDLFIGDYWISDNGHVFRRF
jgi:antirestriction protein